jgi:hypothetical protein
MNLLQLRTAVRAEIFEPTAGFWTDAELNTWIGDANDIATAAARVELEPPYAFNTVAATASYALPADFSLVRRLKVGDYDPYPGTVEDILGTSGAPVRYVVLGSKLYLDPIPDAVYASTLWYHRLAPALTETTSPIIPARFHRLLVTYATGQAKRKADDPAYVTYMRDWDNGLRDMAAELSAKGQAERPWQVRDDWSDA